jgi:hypothetical protein
LARRSVLRRHQFPSPVTRSGRQHSIMLASTAGLAGFTAGLSRPKELSKQQLNAISSNRIQTSTITRIELIEDCIESGFALVSDLHQFSPLDP